MSFFAFYTGVEAFTGVEATLFSYSVWFNLIG